MLFLYSLITLIMLAFGKTLYKNVINPVSMYCCLWYVCFFFHECGIINFLPISLNTFFMIVSGNVFVAIGCYLGYKLTKLRISAVRLPACSEVEKMKRLYFWIVIMTIVCGIDVIIKFVRQIQTYSTSIFMNFAYRYSLQLREAYESSMDLSSLIFPLTVYISIYIIQIGLERKIIPSIVVLILFSFIQGARGTLIIVMLLFISQITIAGKISSFSIDFKKNKKKIIIIFSVLLSVVGVITISRNQYFNVGSNANGFANTIGSMVSYTAEGIGCLDQYMKNPEQANYPQYFFRVPVILLNKLGITELDTRYYISTYYIPFPSNVITYLGELYHDFGGGYGIIIVLMSMLFSLNYNKAVKSNSIISKILYSVFFVVFMLSFFANFIHVASVWYVAILGGMMAFTIEHKLKDRAHVIL